MSLSLSLSLSSEESDVDLFTSSTYAEDEDEAAAASRLKLGMAVGERNSVEGSVYSVCLAFAGPLLLSAYAAGGPLLPPLFPLFSLLSRDLSVGRLGVDLEKAPPVMGVTDSLGGILPSW